MMAVAMGARLVLSGRICIILQGSVAIIDCRNIYSGRSNRLGSTCARFNDTPEKNGNRQQ